MSVDSNDGLKTEVNISGGPARTSLTNGSSARKFTAPDSVQNPPEGDETRSNAEYIVGHASGLKTMAMVAEQVAAGARDALDSVRASLNSVAPSPQDGTKSYASTFSDSDLTTAQTGMAKDVSNRLGSIPSAVSGRMASTAKNIFPNSLQSFVPTVEKGAASVNTAVPEIDNVTIQMSKKKGVTDSFYSTVTFNLPTAQVQSGQIRAIRIFRAVVDNPDFMSSAGKLSSRGMDIIRSDNTRSRSKNQDYYSNFENQLSQAGISNAIGTLNAVDPVLGVRTSAASSSIVNVRELSAISLPTGDDRISSDLASFVDPTTLQNLDRSVANDPKSIANLVRNNPHLTGSTTVQTVKTGKLTYLESSTKMGRAQLQDVQSGFQTGGGLVVNAPNKQGFKELTFTAPGDASLTSNIIGTMTQYTFVDSTITYGKAYKYYIVTVDVNMNESTRSRIVQINVDGLRVPVAPKRVVTALISGFISLVSSTDDILVEKFEVYRKEENVSAQDSTQSLEITIHAAASGYVTDRATKNKLSNNYIQIGECLNAGSAGGTFFDRTVKSGQRYSYRVYSVDVFGNKSSAPKEVSVFVPEPSVRNVELRKPSILAEVDSKTGKARVVIQADDSRIKGLFLARRDLTINQISFAPPGQSNFQWMGNGDRARGRLKFQDVRISDPSKDVAWTGYFERPDDQIVFIDNTSQVDHTYQYRIYGVDKFGNVTPYEFSKKLFVTSVPLINEPVNLSAQVQFAPDGSATNVHLTWNDGNIDVSSEDLLGNTEDLRESSVRTLYQVERRRAADDTWQDFPMTQNMFFDDTVVPTTGSKEVPGYRPDMLQTNDTYLYRVAAYQTGTFISNFTMPVTVEIAAPVLAPQNFKITHLDTKQRPFFVILNWDTPDTSGDIDSWEIQRVVVNNLAAANISSKADYQSLDFQPFQNVYLESSRFRESEDDTNSSIARASGSSGLFVGQHYYMDMSVEFGNSYYYRIRATSTTDGTKSAWTYRGVKVTDETFEKKQDVVTTAAEKTTLASTRAPVVTPVIFKNPGELSLSSFSLVPTDTKVS